MKIIGDMIHFIKNRRTQIAIDVIIMKGTIIPVACLYLCFQLFLDWLKI